MPLWQFQDILSHECWANIGQCPANLGNSDNAHPHGGLVIIVQHVVVRHESWLLGSFLSVWLCTLKHIFMELLFTIYSCIKNGHVRRHFKNPRTHREREFDFLSRDVLSRQRSQNVLSYYSYRTRFLQNSLFCFYRERKHENKFDHAFRIWQT